MRTSNRTRAPRSSARRAAAPARKPSSPSWHANNLRFCRTFLSRGQKHTLDILTVRRVLAQELRRQGWLLDGLDGFDTWCRINMGFGEEQARRYMALDFTVGEVRGKVFHLSGLEVIQRAGPYRALMLRHGTSRSEALLQRARDAALACETEEEGAAAIVAILGETLSGQAPAREGAERKEGAPRSLAGCRALIGRGLAQVVNNVEKGEARLDEGETLSEEQVDELAAEYQEAVEVMGRFLARLGAGPDTDPDDLGPAPEADAGSRPTGRAATGATVSPAGPAAVTGATVSPAGPAAATGTTVSLAGPDAENGTAVAPQTAASARPAAVTGTTAAPETEATATPEIGTTATPETGTTAAPETEATAPPETAPTAAPETPATPGPAAPPPEEPWHVAVVRAVLAVLLQPERSQLADLLLMALSGRPPDDLIAFLRGLDARLAPAPQLVRDHLAFWLRSIAHPDLEVRWRFLFPFFATAQLGDFRRDLHALRTVALPPEPLQTLQAALDAVALDPSEPPLHIPPGTCIEGQQLALGEHLLRRAMKFWRQHLEAGEGQVNVLALHKLFGEALDLGWDVDTLLRVLLRLHPGTT